MTDRTKKPCPNPRGCYCTGICREDMDDPLTTMNDRMDSVLYREIGPTDLSPDLLGKEVFRIVDGKHVTLGELHEYKITKDEYPNSALVLTVIKGEHVHFFNLGDSEYKGICVRLN